MANDIVVFDTESLRLATEVPGGWNSVNLMGFSCGVIYGVQDDSYMIYGQHDLPEFKRRLERADLVVTFNGEFDFTLAYELPTRQVPRQFLQRHCDLYRRICVAANKNPAYGHKGFGLGSTCERTLGRGKIDSGENAPQLARDGKFARLHSYCLSDTQLTRDLWRHIEREGYVIGPKGVRIEIPKWQNPKPRLPQSAGLSSGLL